MTVIRECVVLPALFLTVTLLGGLRIGDSVRLLPPPPIDLVLGMILLGCIVRARVVAPELLMHNSRSGLANLSGLIVLLSLFAASTQTFNLVTPERGLLHVMFAVFFLVQLLTTMAAVRDRLALLRGLVVLLGSAFLLRFVALESLYSPGGGTLKRVMTALMEGVTLGGLEYVPNAPVTGYVAFLTLTTFVVGLMLLPYRTDEHGGRALTAPTVPALSSRPALDTRHLVLFLMAFCSCACDAADTEPIRQAPSAKGSDAGHADFAGSRNAALASARVWTPPVVPIADAVLGRNPPGGWQETDDVSCRFVAETVGGTTQKFNCQLADGEVVKVKYGRANPELAVEVAGTRLLSSLGFAADRMFVVRSIRCAGCPMFPFQSLKCLAKTGIRALCFAGGPDYGRSVTFPYAVIERRLPGRRIEATEDQGWAWFELDKIDPARHGASPAEVDAFRLIAVLLAHWDNKAANQRLICPPDAEQPAGSCARPLAMIQDLGATFGPRKLDLHNWRRTPMWQDAKKCRVSMKNLPWGGATFPDRQISEDGRLLTVRLLEQLSSEQMEQLFDSSGMTRFDGFVVEGRQAAAWVSAFQDKVRQIREAGPCPDTASVSSAVGR